MKREQKKVPGYDCGWHGEKCQHDTKGEHGISGGYYLYLIVADEGDLALVFTVHAAEYPATVEEPRRSRLLGGLPLCFWHLHATFPFDMSQIGTKPSPCDVLPSGACYGDGGHYSGPEKILVQHGTPGVFDQPESFWHALETLFADVAPGIRAGRADHLWRVCPACGGTDHQGYVTVQSKLERMEPK